MIGCSVIVGKISFCINFIILLFYFILMYIFKKKKYIIKMEG